MRRQQGHRARNTGGPVRRHLRYVGIAPRTFQVYRRAVNAFFSFLHARSLDLPSSLPELDHLVSEFINECWQEGEPIGFCGHLLSGLQRFFPQCKHHLNTSWLFYNNWNSTIVPSRATPFPKHVVAALASAAAQAGDLRLAAGLLVGFTVFLRTTELL